MKKIIYSNRTEPKYSYYQNPHFFRLQMTYDAYTVSFFHRLRLETSGHQGPEAGAEVSPLDAGQELRS